MKKIGVFAVVIIIAIIFVSGGIIAEEVYYNVKGAIGAYTPPPKTPCGGCEDVECGEGFTLEPYLYRNSCVCHCKADNPCDFERCRKAKEQCEHMNSIPETTAGLKGKGVGVTYEYFESTYFKPPAREGSINYHEFCYCGCITKYEDKTGGEYSLSSILNPESGSSRGVEDSEENDNSRTISGHNGVKWLQPFIDIGWIGNIIRNLLGFNPISNIGNNVPGQPQGNNLQDNIPEQPLADPFADDITPKPDENTNAYFNIPPEKIPKVSKGYTNTGFASYSPGFLDWFKGLFS